MSANDNSRRGGMKRDMVWRDVVKRDMVIRDVGLRRERLVNLYGLWPLLVSI